MTKLRIKKKHFSLLFFEHQYLTYYNRLTSEFFYIAASQVTASRSSLPDPIAVTYLVATQSFLKIDMRHIA